MLSFFSNNQVFNLIILILYTIILRIKSFLDPKVYEIKDDDSALTKWIFSLLGENAFVHVTFSTIIILISAILISNICNSLRIFQIQNLLPSFFFVLLSSLIVEVQVFSPALLGLFFFVLYLRSCMMIYRYHLSFFEIFNIGVWAVLAGIVYTPFYMLLFASIFIIIFFEGLDPKKFLLFFFGVISIALIQGATFFFFDLNSDNGSEMLGLSKYFFSMSYWTFERQLFAGLISLCTVFGLSRYYGSLKKKIMDARKRITFLFLITVLLISIPFFFITTDIHYFVILSLLSALLLALYFDGHKKTLYLEVFHIIFLIILFGFQFNLFSI